MITSKFKIKYSKLSQWFAFSLIEEDVFELKKELMRYWMLKSYSYHLTPEVLKYVFGVSTYHLSEKLPHELESFFPSYEEIIERLGIFDESSEKGGENEDDNK